MAGNSPWLTLTVIPAHWSTLVGDPNPEGGVTFKDPPDRPYRPEFIDTVAGRAVGGLVVAVVVGTFLI